MAKKRPRSAAPGELDAMVAEARELEIRGSVAAELAGKGAVLTHDRLLQIGAALTARFGYRCEDDIEACVRYVVDRYGWLPATVRSLREDDLLFLLHELEPAQIPDELPAPAFGSGPGRPGPTSTSPTPGATPGTARRRKPSP